MSEKTGCETDEVIQGTTRLEKPLSKQAVRQMKLYKVPQSNQNHRANWLLD